MRDLHDCNILDVTVRDGSYLIHHKFSPEKTAEIAAGLSAAGVRYAEISHGIGIGGKLMGFPALVDDEDLLAAAKQAAPELQLAIFISPVDMAVPIIPSLLEYFEIGRVGVNVTEVAEAQRFVAKLKKYQKKASVQLVRCHARPPEEAALAAKQAVEMGADIVYVVDTFGSMRPRDAAEYVRALRSEVKVEVGFHGHNNLGLAIPNTMAALEAGATWLDASLMGVGRGAGNANLEALALLLQQAGALSGWDLGKLCAASERTVLPLFGNPPVSRYVDLLLALEKLDFSPSSMLELCAHSAGTSLEDFVTQVHHKMGDKISVTEAHLQDALLEYGVEYQKMLEALKQ